MSRPQAAPSNWDLPRDEAIPRLLDLHGGRILALGRRLCGKSEDAEDLLQETFLLAYRKWDQFDGRSDPFTWLYTIAARACHRMHRLRSGQPKRMASLEELLPFGSSEMPDLPAAGESPLSRQILEEAKVLVEEAVSELPPTYRMPLILKDIIGFSVLQVGEILGLKEATVKTRLHRARLRVRQEVDRIVPKTEGPPPAYSRQVCLDLLRAKQEALDRGVSFPVGDEVVCERCEAVFRTLDLGSEVCAELGRTELPEKLRRVLLERVGQV